jgi:hypothetical protein
MRLLKMDELLAVSGAGKKSCKGGRKGKGGGKGGGKGKGAGKSGGKGNGGSKPPVGKASGCTPVRCR